MKSLNYFTKSIKNFIYRDLYKLSEKDIIFVSSPQTFDPFMVDVCLALQSGASLVMVDNKIRCDSQHLIDIIFPIGSAHPGVTIMQMTPSIFMRWSSDSIKSRIFSIDSKLSVLAFGGEAFPKISTISKWCDWHGEGHSIRIFNLYGLTEMSCWACVHEVSKNDILYRKEIPIGTPIDKHITLNVDTNGELLIMSKIRKCFQPNLSDEQVLDNEFQFCLHTGDRVELINDATIYFQSRMNAIIKFYGKKFDLTKIESIAKNIDSVDEAVCIFDETTNRLILFCNWDQSVTLDYLHSEIRNGLANVEPRIEIHLIEEFPLTEHGKVNKRLLLDEIQLTDKNNSKPSNQTLASLFIGIVNETLNTKITISAVAETPKRAKTVNDSSFIFLGGSSLKAIQIVDEIERKSSKSIPNLLPMLLNEEFTINKILSFLSQFNGEHVDFVENKQKYQTQRIKSDWNVVFRKCIDATPTICILKDNVTIVSVGSHSKLLCNILISNGQIISKLELPDRIESQVTQINDLYGLVGCYDGYLYCFEFITGNIKWKFNSSGMIKCRALVLGPYTVFGNYNVENNFWCVDTIDGGYFWCKRIGTKSIFSNPVEIDAGKCLVCSLDGKVAAVSISSKSILWTFDAGYPIFSTPRILKIENLELGIFIALVDGTIISLNDSGIPIASYRIHGNIFSSPEIFSDADNVLFFFGSQNHFLYCLNYDRQANSFKEIWKHECDASIRSSALLLHFSENNFILNISTAGTIDVVDYLTGNLIEKWTVEGDVFSTPVFWNQYLFIASRNNSLYCISFDNIFRENEITANSSTSIIEEKHIP